MNKQDINNKHYSLAVVLSLFIVIMASTLMASIINEESNLDKQKKLEEIGYESIESINPLVLDKSNHEIDKTSSNIKLTEEIKRVYSIDIIYGQGTEYLAETVNAKAIYDSNDINKILLEIVSCLKKYPSNIFKEIQIKDYTIEICLVSYFSNDNIALATRDSNNNFKIFLGYNENIEKLERAVHHETYHILEYYMKLEYDINQLYKDWNKYNPKDFSYQKDILLLDTDYVYDLDKSGRHYFVSVYSKISDKEDRAEVFADTMISDSMPAYYLDDAGAIKNKMKLISDVIKDCYYTVEYNPSIYWNRYF